MKAVSLLFLRQFGREGWEKRKGNAGETREQHIVMSQEWSYYYPTVFVSLPDTSPGTARHPHTAQFSQPRACGARKTHDDHPLCNSLAWKGGEGNDHHHTSRSVFRTVDLLGESIAVSPHERYSADRWTERSFFFFFFFSEFPGFRKLLLVLLSFLREGAG